MARTWGHSIEVIGPTARTWLRAADHHVYLLRYTKRISKRYTKHVDQPATVAQARAFARRYQLTLPDLTDPTNPPSPVVNQP